MKLEKHNNNPLFPIFLKAHRLQILIVGGGEVGYEKLYFLLKSSPDAQVTLVADWIDERIRELAQRFTQIQLIHRKFEAQDLMGKNILIAATNNRATNWTIREQAKERNILVNVADTPDLCDFYLGGIVTKGDLKIAISTNGKSPTFAKRFRQLLEQTLPDTIPQILNNLRRIRQSLKDDFAYKVKRLEEITASLVE